MVCDTAALLNEAIQKGRRVLFEGAQGTMLDLDHGTYPFVTSSSAGAGGASTGTGVAPTRIHGVLGVSKAYITRVGGGPFPTEDHGPGGEKLRTIGNEFGAVTGRPRRCGWFDAPLLRYTAMINGFDSLIVTKLDVLDTFSEIPVCTGYRLRGKETAEMPATVEGMAALEPVYENLPDGARRPPASRTTTICPPAPKPTSSTSRSAPASRSGPSPPARSDPRPSSGPARVSISCCSPPGVCYRKGRDSWANHWNSRKRNGAGA